MYLEHVESVSPRPAMQQKRVQLYLLMLLIDSALLLGSFVLAGGVYRNQWPLPFALSMGWAVLPIFLVIATYQRLVMIFYAKAATDFSRVMLSLALVFAFVSMAAARALLSFYIRQRFGPTMSST